MLAICTSGSPVETACTVPSVIAFQQLPLEEALVIKQKSQNRLASNDPIKLEDYETQTSKSRT
jgi:hypothetical protein